MNDLLQKLADVERLAQGSRWQRLLNDPGKYLFALSFLACGPFPAAAPNLPCPLVGTVAACA